MKRKLLSLLLLVCTSGWLFSQTTDGNLKDFYSVNQLANLSPKSTGFPTFSNVNRVKGTPFLFEDWRPGQIQARGGNKLSEQLNLAVDLDKHVLYVQLDNDKYGDIPIEKIQTFTLTDGNKTYWYEVHNLAVEFGIGPRGMKYFRILHDGPNYLVLHYEDKYLRKESHVENLGMVRRPDLYRSQNEYYVYNGKKLVQVKKSSKSIRNAFPKESKRIKKLIKEHDLKVKKEDDFAKLFILLDEKS